MHRLMEYSQFPKIRPDKILKVPGCVSVERPFLFGENDEPRIFFTAVPLTEEETPCLNAHMRAHM